MASSKSKQLSLAPQVPLKHQQGVMQQQMVTQQQVPPPSLFDLFYEEYLTLIMNDPVLSNRVPEDFVRLQTDIERIEYLLSTTAFIREFELKSKFGIKSLEKTVQFREDGNKLFNSDQAMQSILYYNKALTFAPHPTYEEWLRKEPDGDFGRSGADALPPGHRHKASGATSKHAGKKAPPSKYEALALCYANRSAALRKLGQFEECLRDVARAARFGYPRENIYKLWERKGKCYVGLKRYDMAVKCFRQALQSLKESTLSDNQKTLKSHEITGFIKELRTTHGFLTLGSDDGSEGGSVEGAEGPLMGATGPIIIVQEKEPQWRKASTATLPEQNVMPVPPKPERRSFRRKKTPATGPSTPTSTGAPAAIGGSPANGGGGGDTASMGGDSNSSLPMSSTGAVARPNLAHSSVSSPSQAPAAGEMRKTNSQMSISQMSATGIKPDIDVPELSYGVNPRMPSASAAIEVRYAPEKGRFFVANQDLSPGTVLYFHIRAECRRSEIH